uniref:Uncharacterized protein n=1 Tax=Arundo donax TaxID=35708 RepID=A0A0A9AW55_ARUDO
MHVLLLSILQAEYIFIAFFLLKCKNRQADELGSPIPRFLS